MYYVIVFLVRIAMYIWYNLRIEGKENIPKGQAFVYASNHRSYADPVLVTLAGRGRFSFMAKTELFENKLMCRAVSNLLIFPEGTPQQATAGSAKANRPWH